MVAKRTSPPEPTKPLPRIGRGRHYTATVLGDASILPIVESLGRRQLREIDPLSAEGRTLLSRGQVRICHEDGRRVEAVPIQNVLDRLGDEMRQRRDSYPAELRSWTRHHDQVLSRIDRMKRLLKFSR